MKRREEGREKRDEDNVKDKEEKDDRRRHLAREEDEDLNQCRSSRQRLGRSLVCAMTDNPPANGNAVAAPAAEAAPPEFHMVFQCKACRTIVGDSSYLVNTDESTQTFTLESTSHAGTRWSLAGPPN